MRKFSALAVMTFAVTLGLFQPADAGLLGMPMGLQSAIQHIKLEAPTLPPMAYTQFCVRYQDECRKRPIFRGGAVKLTEERWADLREVNQVVNRGIIPENNELGLAGEKWLINPVWPKSSSVRASITWWSWCAPAPATWFSIISIRRSSPGHVFPIAGCACSSRAARSFGLPSPPGASRRLAYSPLLVRPWICESPRPTVTTATI